MKTLFFSLALGALIGAAIVAILLGSSLSQAAASFLLVGGVSVGLLFPREALIRQIDTTNGNDTGLIALGLYGLAAVLATLVASVAALFVAHSGIVNIGALIFVAVIALITALMHR